MARGKRRANGEGTVGRLSDGRWAAKALIQRPDGSYTRIKREGKTRALAMARLDEARRAVQSGGALRSPTVATHVEAWYAHTFAPHVRPNSRRTTRWLIDALIAPALGDLRVDRLRGPRLRQWLVDLQAAGRSAKTISMARSILRQALDQAVEDRLIAANPMTRSIKAPPVPASGGRALTPAQARALLDAARGARVEIGLRLALGLGLRRGEVCGLRWSDIDLDGATLSVRGQATLGEGRAAWTDDLKTRAAIRTLHLPAVLVGALRWHRARQEAEGKAMGWEPSIYVLTSAVTGGLLSPGAFYVAFKSIARAAGLGDYRLHDLRHSAATFLLAEGVSLKKVQQILGHARGATTLGVYGHLLPGEDTDATERVQRRLEDDETKGDEDGARESA